MDKKKIVIVEDDRFLRRVYEEKFRKISDYDIFVAADGASAVTLIKKEHPDLVLLDLVLPEMDGFTVLENIKKDPATADVQVIILSNLGQEDDIVRGKELGAIDYLIKSDISIQAIEDKVRKILQLQKTSKPVADKPVENKPAEDKPVVVDKTVVTASVVPLSVAVTPVQSTVPVEIAVQAQNLNINNQTCSQCGAAIIPGSKFCAQCGNKIS